MVRFVLAAVLAAGPVLAEGPGPFATFAAAGDPVLHDPHDLAFGPDGNLYVADKFADRVVLMDPNTLEVIGSIGDGALSGAHDVSFGPDGRLYVAATGLDAVVVYDLTKGVPRNEGALTPFPRTEGVLAHSNGRLYVMASGSGHLVSVENDKVLAARSGFPGAHDVAEAPDGTLWIADTVGRRLVRFSADLEPLGVISGPAYGFVGPRYLDFDPDGMLVVADQDAHRILKIDPADGALLGVLGTGAPGLGPNLFDDPEGVAIRGSEFFFSDSDNNRIVKYVVVLN